MVVSVVRGRGGVTLLRRGSTWGSQTQILEFPKLLYHDLFSLLLPYSTLFPDQSFESNPGFFCPSLWDFRSEVAAYGANTQLGQVFNVSESRRRKTEGAVDGGS